MNNIGEFLLEFFAVSLAVFLIFAALSFFGVSLFWFFQ